MIGVRSFHIRIARIGLIRIHIRIHIRVRIRIHTRIHIRVVGVCRRNHGVGVAVDDRRRVVAVRPVGVGRVDHAVRLGSAARRKSERR
jgi:hypothetical protein